VEKIEVGSLVIFLEEFKGDTIPNVGIVVDVIDFNNLIGEELGEGIMWYAVLFGDVDMVVSSEMIILLS
jgi:hypothetical protein